MNQYAVTVAIPADSLDDAIRGLRRMVRELPKDELAERCHLEQIIGDPTLDADWTLAEVREALGVGA
jgi:hypothetical protein